MVLNIVNLIWYTLMTERHAYTHQALCCCTKTKGTLYMCTATRTSGTIVSNEPTAGRTAEANGVARILVACLTHTHQLSYPRVTVWTYLPNSKFFRQSPTLYILLRVSTVKFNGFNEIDHLLLNRAGRDMIKILSCPVPCCFLSRSIKSTQNPVVKTAKVGFRILYWL